MLYFRRLTFVVRPEDKQTLPFLDHKRRSVISLLRELVSNHIAKVTNKIEFQAGILQNVFKRLKYQPHKQIRSVVWLIIKILFRISEP